MVEPPTFSSCTLVQPLSVVMLAAALAATHHCCKPVMLNNYHRNEMRTKQDVAQARSWGTAHLFSGAPRVCKQAEGAGYAEVGRPEQNGSPTSSVAATTAACVAAQARCTHLPQAVQGADGQQHSHGGREGGQHHVLCKLV
jgi:hypothetical protein